MKLRMYRKECIEPSSINIIDASPGTACPVVKAPENADVAVLVTEPTPFGLNDLKLAVAMSLKMGIPTGIIVNMKKSFMPKARKRSRKK